MVWYRLKHDLTRDGWLTTRQCENVSVTQWSNSLLAAVVERRYLPDDSTRRQLHDLLATYWLGASGVDQQSQYGRQNGLNQCANNSNSRSSKPVVYDADQPLMFERELAPGKPRFLQWIDFLLRDSTHSAVHALYVQIPLLLFANENPGLRPCFEHKKRFL